MTEEPLDTYNMPFEDMLEEPCPLNQVAVFPDRAFKEGRLIQDPTPRQDPSTGEKYFAYRKILDNYDEDNNLVSISKEGSKLNPEPLNELEQKVSPAAIMTSELGKHLLRPKSWDISKPAE